MKLRRGHLIALSMIAMLAAADVWLAGRLAASDNSFPEVAIPEPLQMATFTKVPTERRTDRVGYYSRGFCPCEVSDWGAIRTPIHFELSVPVEAGFGFPSHASSADSELDWDNPSKAHEMRIVPPGGVAPMPFGGSMFGPWDADRDSSLSGP